MNNNVLETAAKLKVGRSMVFSLWKNGELGSVTIGKRRFSTDGQIADFIRRLELSAAGAQS